VRRDRAHRARGERAQQRRLALAVAPDERVDAPARERERRVLEQLGPATRVGQGEGLGLDRTGEGAELPPQLDGVGDGVLERGLLGGALHQDALVRVARRLELRLALRLALLAVAQRLVYADQPPAEARVVL